MTQPTPRPTPTLNDIVSMNSQICASLLPGEELDEVILAFKSGLRCCLNVPKTQAGDGFSLSPDGRTFRWKNGKTYTFSPNQGAAVLLLVAAYRDGTRDVSIAALLEAGPEDSDCTRVRDLFRSSEAWDDRIIGQSQRGSYRLMEPDEIE